jgi:hypothetical protein
MSILIRSTADWFRCISSTVPERHFAAFAKLGRLLAGAASLPTAATGFAPGPDPNASTTITIIAAANAAG